MGFWKNVESEREYQGISRKELAFRANIAYAGIGLGLERDSMPGADTALRISKVLGVSLEYLLGEEVLKTREENYSDAEKIVQESLLYHSNKKTIDALESLPTHIKEPVVEMILRMAKSV